MQIRDAVEDLQNFKKSVSLTALFFEFIFLEGGGERGSLPGKVRNESTQKRH